jgi:hypothetical protein
MKEMTKAYNPQEVENKIYKEWEGSGMFNPGKLYGYEVKWSKSKAKKPMEWLRAYANSQFEIVNNENYQNFIL